MVFKAIKIRSFLHDPSYFTFLYSPTDLLEIQDCLCANCGSLECAAPQAEAGVRGERAGRQNITYLGFSDKLRRIRQTETNG